ncbi:MAG: galactose mutarotase [Bacteroidales bacterium]|nr:galactose mutarotase [Bacteroidales bacterium]MCF8403862.1 galactose mutarotase [Bacteroidales bacterium]
MEVNKELYGNIDEEDIFLFTLKNSSGFTVQITNYGGIITSIKTPDKNGYIDEVVLGYDNLKSYLIESPYFGAIVGRFVNRIANGRFTLDGKEYRLTTNELKHHLHGGKSGFDKKVWKPLEFTNDQTVGIKLYYFSPDGEEGYPGNLDVEVVYSITPDSELIIDFKATTDKPTPINLSQHSYFNLSGTSGRNILGHHLMLDADKYLEVDELHIPTGEIKKVNNTQMDFRKSMEIGARIGMVGGGYDHNYILNNKGKMAKVAELFDPYSGRVMEVRTTQPGIQFYSGNFLDGSIVGEYGLVYQRHHGLCLETQHFPDSPNHPNFPDTILRPGEKYHHQTSFKFGIK